MRLTCLLLTILLNDLLENVAGEIAKRLFEGWAESVRKHHRRVNDLLVDEPHCLQITLEAVADEDRFGVDELEEAT